MGRTSLWEAQADPHCQLSTGSQHGSPVEGRMKISPTQCAVLDRVFQEKDGRKNAASLHTILRS